VLRSRCCRGPKFPYCTSLERATRGSAALGAADIAIDIEAKPNVAK
jgi:hypothetical protein